MKHAIAEQMVPRKESPIEPIRLTGFEDFFRSNHDTVYRAICTTLGGELDIAADAVDEAMARAYQRWSKVQGYDNPAGWVYRVALNYARTRLRRRARRRAVATNLISVGESDFDPALFSSLVGLPLEQRAVIVLKYYLDWTLPQIADALGIPEGTVKSRLGRGLDRLRQEVNLEF